MANSVTEFTLAVKRFWCFVCVVVLGASCEPSAPTPCVVGLGNDNQAFPLSFSMHVMINETGGDRKGVLSFLFLSCSCHSVD